MTRSKRLDTIAGIAGKHEKEAAKVLSESQSTLAGREERLAELERYRAQYVERFEEHSRAGVSAAAVKDFRLFLARLDQAIVQAEAAVCTAAEACREDRSEWLARRTRCKAVEKVADRRRTDEARQAERLEQRAMDEHAMRRSGLDRGEP